MPLALNDDKDVAPLGLWLCIHLGSIGMSPRWGFDNWDPYFLLRLMLLRMDHFALNIRRPYIKSIKS